MPETKTQYFPFGGGLDVVTPAISINPGRALALNNFEPWFNGGYRRILGFERFDGRPKPSAQNFVGFEVSASEDVSVDDVLTGTPSGASGTVIGVYEDDGTRGNDMLALTKITGGPFVNGDDLGVNVTNGDEDIVPDANATDTDSVLVLNDFRLIDEGVDNADTLVNDTIRNVWPGGAVVQWSLSDFAAHVTTINTWTLRVRARVIRKGDAIFRSGNVYAISPESDDTVTYQFLFTPGGDSQNLTFTDVDAGAGFITRTITQASATATRVQINAELVELRQTAFSMQGNLFDGLSLEIAAIDLVIDYDGDVVILSDPIVNDAATIALGDQFLLAAQNDFRDDIAVVPGSGPVRAAWQLGAAKYAIRDNAGATAGILHVASATGWTTTGVTMASFINFDTGLAAGASVNEGDTLTGGTSGATATLHRIILNGGSGAFDGTGKGYFVLTGIVGGPFQNGELLESPALTTIATAVGVDTAFAFSVGGIYEFHNHNFFAGAGTLRAYGANGVDDAFEIDENGVVSPIMLPALADVVTAGEVPPVGDPFLVEEHRNHLFLGFPGGRYVQSVIGLPMNFSGFLGAAEFGAGDELTGLQSIVSNVLVVTTEREARGLFGTNILDWELKLLTEVAGGRLYSVQKVDTVYALDDLGVTSIARTDAFGDFVGQTISQLIQPLLDAERPLFTDSTIVRKSNQYRMYFTDKTALVMYIPFLGSRNQIRAQFGTATRVNVEFGALTYPFNVTRIWNTEDETGAEQHYFITDDAAGLGFVYQDQIGRNFDGANIESWVKLAFNQVGSPSYKKRFRQADLELNTDFPVEIRFVADLSYGAEEGSTVDLSFPSTGGFYDIDNWDQFLWDGQAIGTLNADLDGSGENISFLLFNDSAFVNPFTLQGLTLHYERRRLQR